MYLCELCFDALTSHSTDAWDGLPTAVCDACLAPPRGHRAWDPIIAHQVQEQVAAYDRGPSDVAALRRVLGDRYPHGIATAVFGGAP